MFLRKHMVDDHNKSKAQSSTEKSHFTGKSFFSVVRDFVDGDVFLRVFFQNHYKFLLLLFSMSMFYVNNRFVYERKLRDLDKARKEMIDLKYRSLSLSKELKVAGRRTYIREHLKNQGSELDESDEPVVIIKK